MKKYLFISAFLTICLFTTSCSINSHNKDDKIPIDSSIVSDMLISNNSSDNNSELSEIISEESDKEIFDDTSIENNEWFSQNYNNLIELSFYLDDYEKISHFSENSMVNFAFFKLQSSINVSKYLSNETNYYTIPFSVLEPEIKKYFKDIPFDKTKSKFYSSEEDSFIHHFIVGNENKLSVDEVKKIDDNKVMLLTSVRDSFDENTILLNRKIVLDKNKNNYSFVSVQTIK